MLKKLKCWWLGHEDVLIAKERVAVVENGAIVRNIITMLFRCERCNKIREHETLNYYRSMDPNQFEVDDQLR